MKITEQSSTRLVIGMQQKYLFTAFIFAALGIGGAVVGLAFGTVTIPWACAMASVGALVGLGFIWFEKRLSLTFDADAGEIIASKRVGRRRTIDRIPLADVTGVGILVDNHHEFRLYSLRFLGPRGEPLPYKHYLTPEPSLEPTMVAMQDWIVSYRERNGLPT